MLKDILDKHLKNKLYVISATGECRFCRHIATNKALPEWDEEEINELITEACECDDARTYTHKKGQNEKAHNRIEALFGKENKTIVVPDKAVELLHNAVCPVCDELLVSVAVDIGHGIKGRISITPKGIVKVARTITNVSTYEI